ncbi:MAG: hypothetical protein AAF541_07350 [Pseudomonadota bacterium]
MDQIDIPELVKILGGDYLVQDVRHRIRCEQCGQRTRNMRIVYVGPGGRAAGFRYTR